MFLFELITVIDELYLFQDSANIIAEHEKLKQENSVLVAALKKNAAEEDN